MYLTLYWTVYLHTGDRVWDAGITDWLASGARVIIEERAAKYIAPKGNLWTPGRYYTSFVV